MSNGNISALAIRHPIPPIVLFAVLVFAGIASYLTLDVANNPDIDYPVVTVSVSRPGGAPAELETQVTKKIENAVGSITGLDHITSTVVEGSSQTVLEFKIGYNTDRAVNDVRDAVSRVRSELPQDIYEPQVARQDVSGSEILIYNITSSSRSIEELSWLVDNDMTRTLNHVPGVGLVERFGGQTREIRVNLDPRHLMAAGITADEVNEQLRNLNLDMPGGRGNVGKAEQSIRTLGGAHSVEQLADTEIAVPNGGKVRLKTLGEVSDASSELRTISRLDGLPSLGFAITRAPNSSEVAVADGVAKAIVQMKKDYPDVQFQLVLDFVKFTKESFLASIESLVLGTLLAVGVVWWFLRDGRATAISSLAMPLSTIPTFLAMKWLGFTLNSVTLLALALVVGILVDDAIVEIENIVRHIHLGKRPFAAALDAAEEIGLAVVATTLTIVSVFVPVSFMPGVSGQYFRSFGITVAVAVLFSLLVARLLTPMMAAYFLKPRQEIQHRPKWMGTYLHLLGWCLGHRRWTVAGGVLVLLLSIGVALMLPSGFLPNQDVGFSVLEFQLPPGATLEETDTVNQQLTTLLKARPEVASVWARAGRGGKIQTGRLFVILTDRSRRTDRKTFEAAIEPELRKVPGIHIGFLAVDGFAAKDVSVLLTSNDGEALEVAANELRRQMQALPYLANVASTAALQRPEIIIRPRAVLAAEQGVSVSSIAQVAKIATLGEIDTNSAKFNLADRQVPIRVLIDPKWRDDLDMLSLLRVRTASGQLLPLTSVAEIAMGSSAAEIDRFDRARKVSVEADLHGKDLGDAMAEINRLPILRDLPAGVSHPSYGNSEEMQIMFVGFALALLTGLLLNLAVLTVLFRNVFQPLTIMTALPLSLGGAFVALLVCHMTLSMPALIGIIMLMGIVTKNSILLVEYAIMARRDRGMDRLQALMDAGAKRARPILMTTIAMVAGMAPIALGLGNDAEFRQPMAVAVIGGLLSSTLLSLVFIPVMFTILDDIQNWLAPKFSRWLTPREEPGASVAGSASLNADTNAR
ncbi:efflux RND transporter permease subunit [Telmatospirillum sp.]|uniref:efflux RND transporter permease subunit n=1 Tax=Telmatospirillum sp. TaxID=2079197 RepID=UPI00283E3055|nr:efflux RND transporter permease subunit [Telmatospirillum sp.]MDR3435827.1 efflux RND transporter permease subunit [Telmatospirillum sp.]